MPGVIAAADRAILLFVQEHIRCPLLDALLRTVTHLGDMGLLWIVLGLGLLAFRRTRTGGLGMLSGLAAEFVICDLVIKRIVMRPRPYTVIAGLQRIIEEQASSSFPSGHSASSFACAFLLTCFFGKKGAWAYLPAALIALSRVYVGVHYPSDVLAGMLLGTLVGAVVWRICVLVRRRGAQEK